MSDSGRPGIKKMSSLGQAIFWFFSADQEWSVTSPDSSARDAKWKEVVAAHNRLLRVWREVRRRAMDFPDHFPHTVLEAFGDELSDWSQSVLTWRTAGGFTKPLATDVSIEQLIAETNACLQTEQTLGKTTNVLIKKSWAIEDRLKHAASKGSPSVETNHSDDFTSVNWFGTRYTFTKGNQAESVRVLWKNWEDGDHSLSQETIRAKIESADNQFRLSHVFRSPKDGGGREPHPAWGTMIQSTSKGSYKLAPPARSSHFGLNRPPNPK